MLCFHGFPSTSMTPPRPCLPCPEQVAINQQLALAQEAIEKLRQQADEAAAAVSKEREMVEALRQEAKGLADASRQLRQLEAQQQETASRATELIQAAFQVEKQLVSAFSAEGSCDEDAERMAKEAAAEVHSAIQKLLGETEKVRSCACAKRGISSMIQL